MTAPRNHYFFRNKETQCIKGFTFVQFNEINAKNEDRGEKR